MAHTWWHVWGEVGERSNKTLDTGQQKAPFNPGGPQGKYTDKGELYYYSRPDGTPITGSNWSLKDLAYPLNLPFGGKDPTEGLEKGTDAYNAAVQDKWKFASWFFNQMPTEALLPVMKAGSAARGKYFYKPPTPKKNMINVTPKETPVKGEIPKYSSGPVVQTKEGTFYRPTERLASQFAYTGEGTITKPFVIPKGNTLAARDSRKLLRENYSSWIREEMKKPEIRRPEDIDRRGRIIQTSDGESLSMQGVKKVWNAIKRGETDAEIAAKTGKNAYITFGATNPESKGIRVKKMQPPVEEARAELIKNRPDLAPEQLDEIVKAWNKASKHGYASTAETARWEGLRYDQREQELKLKSEGVKKYKTPVSEKTRPQLAAGHGRSVMSKVDHYTKPKGYTGRLYDAPTDQQSVRLENAIENIKHGNKPEGDINFYAAKKAGWPTTWKESIHNFVDKYLGENKLPDWRQNLNNAQVEKILKIPSNWSEAKVDVYWEKYIEPLTNYGDIKQSWEIWEDISRRSRRGLLK